MVTHEPEMNGSCPSVLEAPCSRNSDYFVFWKQLVGVIIFSNYVVVLNIILKRGFFKKMILTHIFYDDTLKFTIF